jgi:hypothetical protein
MSTKARIDVDVVYQEGDATTITVGSLSEHFMPAITTAQQITGTVGTTAVQIVGSPPLSTLAVKNTGAGVLRLAGAVDVTAGRLAVLPVTATITVSAPGGSGTYSAIWVG